MLFMTVLFNNYDSRVTSIEQLKDCDGLKVKKPGIGLRGFCKVLGMFWNMCLDLQRVSRDAIVIM